MLVDGSILSYRLFYVIIILKFKRKFMKYSIILFVVLFVVIWVIHKPFDVHNTKLNKLHEWLEFALVVKGIIILNQLLMLLK